MNGWVTEEGWNNEGKREEGLHGVWRVTTGRSGRADLDRHATLSYHIIPIGNNSS